MILGAVLIMFTTVINALGVKLMARINSTGVFIELIAAVLLIILLGANITRGPEVLLETHGTARATTGATSAPSWPPRWPRPT